MAHVTGISSQFYYPNVLADSNYIVSHMKEDIALLSVISPNIVWFLKFFHLHTQ